jgi:hypothetical protein
MMTFQLSVALVVKASCVLLLFDRFMGQGGSSWLIEHVKIGIGSFRALRRT